MYFVLDAYCLQVPKRQFKTKKVEIFCIVFLEIKHHCWSKSTHSSWCSGRNLGVIPFLWICSYFFSTFVDILFKGNPHSCSIITENDVGITDYQNNFILLPHKCLNMAERELHCIISAYGSHRTSVFLSNIWFISHPLVISVCCWLYDIFLNMKMYCLQIYIFDVYICKASPHWLHCNLYLLHMCGYVSLMFIYVKPVHIDCTVNCTYYIWTVYWRKLLISSSRE
jgi:hypothetical protein